MSKPEESLSRLLRAAARRESQESALPSPGLIRRVLVDWRSSEKDQTDPASAFFAKWAVLSSAGLAALVLLLNLSTIASIERAQGWRAADVQLMDSVLQTQIP